MNAGKIFEGDFKKSVPNDTYYVRLHDSASSFVGSDERSKLRFSMESPYDCILCRNGQMYALELKTNSGTSMSFAGKSPRIKPNQIKHLFEAYMQGNCVSGLVLNFRTYDTTYFVPIDVFRQFMTVTKKKSISAKDAKELGMIIPEWTVRTRKRYDLTPILLYRDSKNFVKGGCHERRQLRG